MSYFSKKTALSVFSLVFISLSAQSFANDCYVYSSDIQEAIATRDTYVAEKMSSPELVRLQSQLNRINVLETEINNDEVEQAKLTAKEKARNDKMELLKARIAAGERKKADDLREEEKEQRHNQVKQQVLAAKLANKRDSLSQLGDKRTLITDINDINRKIQDPKLLEQLNRLDAKVRKARGILGMCEELSDLKLSCPAATSSYNQ